jgi:uncharacterized repeat protein (TIGR04052 family)
VAACSRSQRIDIPFVATWHEHTLTCGKSDEDPGVGVTDLRFFLSEFRLVDGSGHEVAARPIPDDRWQDENVSLIDFGFGCGPGQTRHTLLSLRAPGGSFRELRFKVGVPFEVNHGNPAATPGPLGVAAMALQRQSGHMFLKLEGKNYGIAYRLHVGSMFCEGSVGHVTTCHHPNRAEVSVPLTGGGIVFDVAEILDPDMEVPTGCESENPVTCAYPFSALGLQWLGGEPKGTQHVFRAR